MHRDLTTPAQVGLLVLATVLGLAIGSFLNVVIYRLPRDESLSQPPSHCPNCDAPIKARHNVPVFGWLILRGRCANCREPISPRYPLVEAGTGLLFLFVTWRLIALDLLSTAPAYLYLAAIGVALALIDLDLHRLPNKLVLPAYPVLAVLLAGAAVVDHDYDRLLRAAIGAVAAFAFFFVISLVQPGGMGWGDVKLSGVLGLALGYLSWVALVVGIFAGFLLGAVVGLAIMLTGKANRKTKVPFGPFMIVGTFLMLFWIPPVAQLYQG